MVDLRLSPPPWSLHETRWEFQIRDADGRIVATTIDRFAAYLMAAGPQLYEACEAALHAFNTNPMDRFLTPEEEDAIEKLRSALAKARGESS